MASLFLSYSREECARVGRSRRRSRPGPSGLVGPHISGGQEFVDDIEMALESAEAVVVCWTGNLVRSGWVRDEAGAGRDRGRLVPVTLDGCLPPSGFRQYHTIDLSRWNGRMQVDRRSIRSSRPSLSGRAAFRRRSRRPPSHSSPTALAFRTGPLGHCRRRSNRGSWVLERSCTTRVSGRRREY